MDVGWGNLLGPRVRLPGISNGEARDDGDQGSQELIGACGKVQNSPYVLVCSKGS